MRKSVGRQNRRCLNRSPRTIAGDQLDVALLDVALPGLALWYRASISSRGRTQRVRCARHDGKHLCRAVGKERRSRIDGCLSESCVEQLARD